jgi:hypothetical protein
MTAEEDRFFQTYPELHHYTRWGALQGIFTTNTLRATHYKCLNDLTEVEHMKEYLATLVPRNRVERRSAKSEIESLYKKTFTQFVSPYITSFTTHAADADFDGENGVLDQWSKYGRHGYAIVFDTKFLNDLLNREFDTHLYTQTTFSNVVYNFGIDHFKASFEQLITEAAWFIWDKAPLPKGYARAEEFINDFIKTTCSFKHSDWSKEREVRIVAHPKHPSELKYIRESDSDDIKALRSRSPKEIFYREINIPFLNLFGDLGKDLPIKRIIVTPDENQEFLWRQASTLTAGRVPVYRSEIELRLLQEFDKGTV